MSSDSDFTEDELHWVTALYQALGIVEFVPECLLDAVCGLSGEAPAYVAMFIEAMADGGVQQGLPSRYCIPACSADPYGHCTVDN